MSRRQPVRRAPRSIGLVVRSGIRARLLVLAALSAAVLACARPHAGTAAATAIAARAKAQADSADSASRAATPIVQVRSFASSATVAVLGWTEDDSRYGLRAEVNRDGALIDNFRPGDHRLYVSTLYAETNGGFTRAAIMTTPLMLAPVVGRRGASDPDACHGGDRCVPVETFRLSIPDSVLRTPRDSLVVRFDRLDPSSWSLTVRRPLIDAYLRAVDSVRVAMRNH